MVHKIASTEDDKSSSGTFTCPSGTKFQYLQTEKTKVKNLYKRLFLHAVGWSTAAGLVVEYPIDGDEISVRSLRRTR